MMSTCPTSTFSGPNGERRVVLETAFTSLRKSSPQLRRDEQSAWNDTMLRGRHAGGGANGGPGDRARGAGRSVGWAAQIARRSTRAATELQHNVPAVQELGRSSPTYS